MLCLDSSYFILLVSLNSSYFILLVSLDSNYFILLVSLLPVLILKYFLSLGPIAEIKLCTNFE